MEVGSSGPAAPCVRARRLRQLRWTLTQLARAAALFWLRPTEIISATRHPFISFRGSLKESWRGLGRMFLEWRRLPNAFTFLAAWFLLSDCENGTSSSVRSADRDHSQLSQP